MSSLDFFLQNYRSPNFMLEKKRKPFDMKASKKLTAMKGLMLKNRD